jgi:glutamate 5-kinase
LKPVRRMVIKVGTAIITEKSGRINHRSAANLAAGIVEARRRGIDVALVSSGAIAAGMEKLGLAARPKEMETLQAIASVGQGLLVGMYADLFSRSGVAAGQVLLTQHDFTHRQQYLNARKTMERLFEMGAVPVINENDTVATEEISFGDNDMLASLVASLIGADLLVLVTDTAGLHTADPRTSSEARLIGRVDRITEEIEGMAGEPGSHLSLGGMSSKVQAAKVAVSSGVNVIIADGRLASTIEAVLDGEAVGTFFPASEKVRSRKRWIGYARKSQGRLLIDRGAADALVARRKSLLPAGVVGVEGDFEVGDCVDIVSPDGRVIGRGITSYGAAEAGRIKGLRSDQVRKVLGEKGEEIINRDELLVFNESDAGGKAGS